MYLFFNTTAGLWQNRIPWASGSLHPRTRVRSLCSLKAQTNMTSVVCCFSNERRCDAGSLGTNSQCRNLGGLGSVPTHYTLSPDTTKQVLGRSRLLTNLAVLAASTRCSQRAKLPTAILVQLILGKCHLLFLVTLDLNRIMGPKTRRSLFVALRSLSENAFSLHSFTEMYLYHMSRQKLYVVMLILPKLLTCGQRTGEPGNPIWN